MRGRNSIETTDLRSNEFEKESAPALDRKEGLIGNRSKMLIRVWTLPELILDPLKSKYDIVVTISGSGVRNI